MAWFAICLPLMAIGVAIATVPLAYATHHQHRYGHHGSDPHCRGATGTAAMSTGQSGSDWTVCPNCSAVVVDQALHDGFVHAAAMT